MGGVGSGKKPMFSEAVIKERIKASKDKWRNNNLERYNRTKKQWYENTKETRLLKQKEWRQREKENFINQAFRKVRVKFFDEEFIAEEEEKVKKPKRRKRRKNRKKAVVNRPKNIINERPINPNRVPYGYWQKAFPPGDFKNEVDRQRAIWVAQLQVKQEKGYFTTDEYRKKNRERKRTKKIRANTETRNAISG